MRAARDAGSPIFTALVDTLVAPSVLTVEEALDIITASRGSVGRAPLEHRALLEALRDRDAARARRCMEDLGRFEREVNEFAQHAPPDAVRAILRLFGGVR